jgi:outer membrane protein OmpA-like peptidoglycan-associated protein
VRLPIAAALSLATLLPAAAQSAFHLTEKSDFSRYLDGRYVGHVYRESRGTLSPTDTSSGLAQGGARGYEGEFLVLEETLRDMRNASRRVDRTERVRFAVAAGGELEFQKDSGYPSLRGLPAFPELPGPAASSLEPGASWIEGGTRALDFEDSGSFVLLPFLAEYHYLGKSSYLGREALSLKAKFATRWKGGGAKALSSSGFTGAAGGAARPLSEVIESATGTHDLDILVDAGTLSTLFIRDRFDETFVLTGGQKASSERRSGFSLYFYEGAVPLDRGEGGAAIKEALAAVRGGQARRGEGALPEASPSGAGPGPLVSGDESKLDETGLEAAGLELDTSPEGLVLRVRDLRFVADSDAILGSELWRLDAIASALKALPGRSFLVAGHSAGVGKALGELELSIKRAKRVTDELASRGIEAGRLMYRGFGSSRPLEPNDTEEGRAKNRRVEITILD